MKVAKWVFLWAAILSNLWLSAASLAAECSLDQSFLQKNINVRAGKTSVLTDAHNSAIFFESGLHTNTDGTRRSYSVDDFWGEKVALNNLCNAMSDSCAGLTKADLRARRIATQKAMADGWPVSELAATRISRDIIAFGSDNKPCPQTDGFLISATALSVPTGKFCDRAAFIDALEIPALVIPGRPAKGVKSEFESHGAGIGDLVVAVGPTGNQVFGVVGDSGPPKKLGEASIAMNGRLLGKSAEPANYGEIRQGWDVRSATILIFPGSRKTPKPYMTVAEIDAAAKERFENWGGMERLHECSLQYRRAVDSKGPLPAR